MTVVVRRDNFKQLRKSYGITLKEIARKCQLSVPTIQNFENNQGLYQNINAREYNSKLMVRMLEDMIVKKEEDIRMITFDNDSGFATNTPLMKESKHKEKAAVRNSNKPTDISRKEFAENLNKYLYNNKLSMREFCNMCSIAHSVFYPSYVKTNPYLSVGHLKKVKDAKGWTDEQIRSGSFVEEDVNMAWIATQKSKAALAALNEESKSALHDKLADKLKDSGFANKSESNVKYVFDGSCYYKEYDIVKHVVESISKEEFIKHIG